MRILDLGCHDGYVSLWLARRLRAQGVEVEVDGVELNSEAATIAQRRLKAEGIDGVVVCADALDADKHLPTHHYDAVVLYELIEHVPEPAELLRVAEAMVKPGGRIYVSTPDGTFGAGNNPHHLRVYRAQDLADLLRRRGRLEDMAVGPDAVTIAAYTPAPRRGDVAIYLGPGWERFSPYDIERKGLGGSETAAIRVAEQLDALGYVVTVYAEVKQCAYRNVIFRHHSVFDPMERRDVLIASRIPEVFERPVNARVRMLWLHDTDCGPRLTQRRAEAIDHVLVLSRWHAQHVAGMYPFLRRKLRRTRNGIFHGYFRQGPQPERARRVLYTSSPDRGLDKLLELWPRVREQVPDATLAYCYSGVYNEVARQRPEVARHHELIQRLASECEGVTPLGALSQPQLAHLMRSSLVWAHPSWATPYDGPFFETSCIGAMEAQAAGCLVVCSAWGALPETVVVGRKIEARPPSRRWQDAFVREIVDGLTNPETQRWAQERGPEAVAELGWGGVARQIAGLIEGETAGWDDPAEPKRAGAVSGTG